MLKKVQQGDDMGVCLGKMNMHDALRERERMYKGHARKGEHIRRNSLRSSGAAVVEMVGW